ncbi:MAG TPA: cytochrome ubiquinol oxidase subunit I, partial [Nordella sp.]|nr:cytochrome ubiquinol oxidase subunit I [Nordella sp.]
WWAIIFNPSFPYRLVHMVIAAYLTTALVVGAVGAWHLLRDRMNDGARVMFSMAMWMLAIVAPIQILAGDMHGLNTLEHQPAKIAAMEGHFETRAGAPLILFGWPDMEAEKTLYEIAIPSLGSLILTHDWNGVVKGLKEWPKEDRPNALIVFWSFRIMVGLGFLMFGLGLWSLWGRFRKQLYETKSLHIAALLMGPMGFVAVLAGWVTTEAGRQPYTVYGLLRTADSVAPIAAEAVAASLIAFVVVYFFVFGAGVFYLLRLMNKPPHEGEPDSPSDAHLRSAGIVPAPALETVGELATHPEGRR